LGEIIQKFRRYPPWPEPPNAAWKDRERKRVKNDLTLRTVVLLP
jgi:hypothetical protein